VKLVHQVGFITKEFYNDPHLLQRLRMSGVISLLPQGAFIMRTETTLTLPRKWKYL